MMHFNTTGRDWTVVRTTDGCWRRVNHMLQLATEGWPSKVLAQTNTACCNGAAAAMPEMRACYSRLFPSDVLAYTDRTRRAVRAYGASSCLEAYRLSPMEGASSIALGHNIANLNTTRQVDAAISAGEEISDLAAIRLALGDDVAAYTHWDPTSPSKRRPEDGAYRIPEGLEPRTRVELVLANGAKHTGTAENFDWGRQYPHLSRSQIVYFRAYPK
ncbi:hypothetical protein E2P84_22425 [Burkholderia cepacia]|uniref:Uncharacterized protein n=1 Tax=Burkholderia cepacia TaxID=292 RepID=A0AAX2RJA9_BURCE|nr:hypothetical protein [Burkholderia cepacia]TES73117.1 hypothetical protein E2P84_22425 [Burkholderia cepacia]TES99196.1 hypothetical protein E3D36_26220 [Burkholderia cepacia]TEU40062.1 hypothetical protein E3D37_29375 [Burkholderia cepacia]TEU46900.1 hypothetical protein E3D38_24380 [Burkholderia cepacia]TEU93517.1 hypothetical protein E3D40_27945 [Burkholderia cepacia]